jgi:Vacuolar protein sorting-associated protein 35
MPLQGANGYKNPQRTLECLQRSLKLADACVTSDPRNGYLFVDLLEDYLYFFEEGNPVITDAYITGLVALIQEHLESVNGMLGMEAHAIADAQCQFLAVCDYIKTKKADSQTAERFGRISIGGDA